LNTCDYVLVETQVVPQVNWDRRALAYAAAFYGNQLRKGDTWKDITKVICINILGGGLDHQSPWKGDQLMKHYRMQEQIRGIEFMDGLEIFQYSLAKLSNGTSQEQQDWIKFLRDGHEMTEAEVEKVKTPAVRRAYDKAKLSQLSKSQSELYNKELWEYDRFSAFP
jgi:predicted transposase/invertase (TIGR01784 family)